MSNTVTGAPQRSSLFQRGLLTVTILVVSASVAHSQQTPVMTLSGQCVRLAIDGDDLTSGCQPLLLSWNQDPDLVLFQFALSTGSSFIFVGRDLPNPTRDTDQISVVSVQVYLGIEGVPPSPAAADGTCLFSNPYSGRATIQCSAQMRHEGEQRAIEAVFVTDGSTPTISGQ